MCMFRYFAVLALCCQYLWVVVYSTVLQLPVYLLYSCASKLYGNIDFWGFFFTFQFLFSCPTCLWMHRGVVNPPVKAACLHYLALYWLEQDILPQSTPKLLLWRSDSLTLSFCKFTFSQNSTACICISHDKLYFVISVFSSKTTHKGTLSKKMTKYLPIWGYLTIDKIKHYYNPPVACLLQVVSLPLCINSVLC